MPCAEAPGSALDVGHEQRAEPLAAPVLCDRKCEFAFEPIGCKRIARLANRDRCAIDVRLSEQRPLVFSVEMDHAVEFRWGQFIQRTEKRRAVRLTHLVLCRALLPHTLDFAFDNFGDVPPAK